MWVTTRNSFHHLLTVLWSTCFLHIAFAYSIDNSNSVNGGDGISSALTSGHVIVAGVVCVVVFVLIVVLVVPGCMDCMNSEVSSESHPACMDTTHKWGGATGYTPTNSSDDAGFRTGEVVNPGDTSGQPLPYSMIPTNIPEQSGFVGYQMGGGEGGAMGSGLAGYTTDPRRGSGPSAPAQGPTHYNPLEPQEPPPAYSETRSGYQ